MTSDPTSPTAWHATAAGHLERLALALVQAGLSSTGRHDVTVPELRVFHPDLPSIGLTVTAIERPNGANSMAWLFYLSTGVVTSPCDDIPAAVQDVKNALWPVYEALARRVHQ
jgi:hypothetical protein